MLMNLRSIPQSLLQCVKYITYFWRISSWSAGSWGIRMFTWSYVEMYLHWGDFSSGGWSRTGCHQKSTWMCGGRTFLRPSWLKVSATVRWDRYSDANPHPSSFRLLNCAVEIFWLHSCFLIITFQQGWVMVSKFAQFLFEKESASRRGSVCRHFLWMRLWWGWKNKSTLY